MQLGQRRRRGTRRGLVRALSLLAAVLLVAESSFAWALPWLGGSSCCESAASAEVDPESDDQEPAPDCPCPLDCSKGCVGLGSRAIPVALPSLVIAPCLAVALSAPMPSVGPVRADPADIQHVPKI